MAENSYAQLIDDFENGINVLKGETLTEYIKRMGGVDYESKADGGAIGIEVLFTDKKAKGGRVGFQSGGWADGLEGEAKGIYDSMTAYGASDAEIQSKLQAQNLWSPDGSGGGGGGTGQVTGIINQNIGRDDGPYAGQIVDQTDYSFNKKNYAPGGKLEINPEALGIGFYESGPGGKKDQGFIESFMGAAVPNKMKSTVTMPGYEQFQAVNPNEFRNFIDANIEGIPGNLTRQDLANMYEDYNKFTGRTSNYAGARVPGTAGNLVGMAVSGMSGIPFVGQGINKLGEFFGPQGDRSMQSKYSVDNAGYGQGTSRDEFGTFTGGKTLMGKTKNYVERMENKISDLTDFFSERIEDFDPNNIDADMIDQMKQFNGFYTKQFQAYKNRLATEKINTDFAEQQRQKELQAKIQAEIDAGKSLSQIGKENFTGEGMAFEAGNTDQGGGYTKGEVVDSPSTPGGKYGSPRKDGGLIGYNRGGLATMFTRRR